MKRRWQVVVRAIANEFELSSSDATFLSSSPRQAGYIDKRDFLNTVVREKKKFESSLDDAVAQGLNAAVNILMSHVDYLLTTGQGPTDFCPDDNADLDLRPTKTAREVVDNLKRHCDMLKGSTDKHILEVFNQEVGIRLHGFAISLSLSLFRA